MLPRWGEIVILECCLWNSPVVDYCIIIGGLALPTIDRGYQRCLVGKAHPMTRNICGIRPLTGRF